MPTVIKAENLSKLYYLGGAKHNSLRDAVMSFVSHPTFSRRKDKLWALRDVNFEVKQGETLGIVGKNGAGKSTLLKILSRVTKPTDGTVEIRGRVGSLLEVGTGFHNELSGRENIFLNGAILGMKRREIEKKFDEIVAFAEIEKFIDTTVKYYSSGMFMRLAFSVAAHLEPEILIVDEVLAVGDASFQKKCLGKMDEAAGAGRTVLFVSHNAAALNRLCSTGIYFETGRIKNCGDIKTILAQYHADLEAEEMRDGEIGEIDVKAGEVAFVEWKILDSISKQAISCFSREEITFEFTLVCRRDVRGAHLGFYIQDAAEQKIFVANSLSDGGKTVNLKAGLYKITWKIFLPIKAGTYSIVAAFDSPDENDEKPVFWKGSPKLVVLPVLENNLSEEWQGILNVPAEFEIEKVVE